MRALLILVTLTATLCALVFVSLGAAWAVIPWLFGIAIWTVYCRSDTGSQPLSKPLAFPFLLFFCLILAAAAVRLYKLSDFPLGFNVDELFTLNNTLILHEKPFDPFGHTPLISEGWVETPNLYLYFNLLILKLAGVRYGSMKLFSVVPGVIACAGVFLIARLMFEIRVAFFTALLFAFGHWPVRLSRYGWDASFMVMTFALAIWLLVLALQRGRTLYAYFAGIAAGVGLYSYLGARMCLLSLLVFLVIDRAIWKQALAFIIGAAATAFPLFCYYVLKPAAFWVRTKEVTVCERLDVFAHHLVGAEVDAELAGFLAQEGQSSRGFAGRERLRRRSSSRLCVSIHRSRRSF